MCFDTANLVSCLKRLCVLTRPRSVAEWCPSCRCCAICTFFLVHLSRAWCNGNTQEFSDSYLYRNCTAGICRQRVKYSFAAVILACIQTVGSSKQQLETWMVQHPKVVALSSDPSDWGLIVRLYAQRYQVLIILQYEYSFALFINAALYFNWSSSFGFNNHFIFPLHSFSSACGGNSFEAI